MTLTRFTAAPPPLQVCLSLLGTWTGRQSCELWNPQSSTVLQVLISIQALVLCEQPYYNEAGYEKQLGTSEGGHHARRYNEGALLLSLKSMRTSLKHASPPFEPLIHSHFAATRGRILDSCRKLLELKAVHPEATAMLNGTSASSSAAASSSTASASSAAAASQATAPSCAAADADVASGATEAAGCQEEPGLEGDAEATDPVSRAGLKGVLNPWPTLGFLHSLERILPALGKTLNEA